MGQQGFGLNNRARSHRGTTAGITTIAAVAAAVSIIVIIPMTVISLNPKGPKDPIIRYWGLG